MTRKLVWAQTAAAAVLAAALAGCSGSSTTTTTTTETTTGNTTPPPVTGMEVASNVSVVDAQGSTGTSKLLSALKKLSALSTVPSTSAYNTDKTNVYVNEKASEAFKTVNMILCMTDQTGYADMVNKGAYKALVNSNACEGNDSPDKSGASAQGGTSGSSAPQYDSWTLQSERTSNTSDQSVTAWVHMTEDGQPMTVEAKMTIQEAASATNPIGRFTFNYKGYNPSTPTKVKMRGVLSSKLVNGKAVISYAEKAYDGSGTLIRTNRAAFEKGTSSGKGSASLADNYGGQNPNLTQTAMDFAYSDTEFKRVIGGVPLCLDRTKFETSAWRYGLYDAATGARATLNGGFSVNTKQDGSGSYGYLGYYGLSLPPGASVGDGQKIYKKVWNGTSETTTEYTVMVKGGKLKKHVRKTATLADIKNIPLEGGDGQSMTRVVWDGTQLKKVATATMTQSGPPTWTEVNEAVSMSGLQWGELNYYSQALGGQVRIKLQNCTMTQGAGGQMPTYACSAPTGASGVVYYVESTVMPGDSVPASLACFDNCPQYSAGDVTGTWPAFGQYKSYTFDTSATGMVLKEGTTEMVKTVTGSQSWGFNSGPLFDAAYATDTSASGPLVCDWTGPNGVKSICGWKAWSELGTFYTWETGTSAWNKFTAVKDAAGSFVKFDPPWQATYIHKQSDQTAYDYKYNLSKFFLQYSGFGDLQGIPGKCVNPETGQTVTDCSKQGLRWVPEFSIPADSTVTVGSTQYLVKPLDMEQRMRVKSSGCTTLATEDYSGNWPTVDATNDPVLGTEPAVTTPPKYIGGVVQQ